MNLIPYARFVFTLGLGGLLYFVFNVLIKEYMLQNPTLADVARSGPYDIFLLVWNGFTLIIVFVEAVRLFMSVQRRSGYA